MTQQNEQTNQPKSNQQITTPRAHIFLNIDITIPFETTDEAEIAFDEISETINKDKTIRMQGKITKMLMPCCGGKK